MNLGLQGRPRACQAGAQPCVPQTDLLAVGILVDQAVGNLQGLEVGAQGRVYPHLPSVAQAFVDLSLTCLPGVTVMKTSGVTC